MCAFVRSKDARLGGSGGCSPRKFLEIRCSEIASGGIFGQKQSHSSYYIFHPMLSCSICILLIKPADFKFPQEKVLRLAELTLHFE